MEIKLKTTLAPLEPNIWCVFPTLLVYTRARSLAFGLAWLKWCGCVLISIKY